MIGSFLYRGFEYQLSNTGHWTGTDTRVVQYLNAFYKPQSVPYYPFGYDTVRDAALKLGIHDFQYTATTVGLQKNPRIY